MPWTVTVTVTDYRQQQQSSFLVDCSCVLLTVTDARLRQFQNVPPTVTFASDKYNRKYTLISSTLENKMSSTATVAFHRRL